DGEEHGAGARGGRGHVGGVGGGEDGGPRDDGGGVGGGGREAREEGLLRRGDLLERLHAHPGAQALPHRAGAEVDEEGGAEEAEPDPQPGDLEQAGGAGHAEGGVGGVDEGGGGADGQAGGDAAPQH